MLLVFFGLIKELEIQRFLLKCNNFCCFRRFELWHQLVRLVFAVTVTGATILLRDISYLRWPSVLFFALQVGCPRKIVRENLSQAACSPMEVPITSEISLF